MSVVTLSELRPLLAAGTRLLGLDLGEKTIGLALSDTLLMVATPMQTLKRGKFLADAQTLSELIAKQGVGGLVVGLPLNMDGTDGPSQRRSGPRLRAGTTPAPNRTCPSCSRTSGCRLPRRHADVAGGRYLPANGAGEVVDKMAAAYILQGALDRLRTMEPR